MICLTLVESLFDILFTTYPIIITGKISALRVPNFLQFVIIYAPLLFLVYTARSLLAFVLYPQSYQTDIHLLKREFPAQSTLARVCVHQLYLCDVFCGFRDISGYGYGYSVIASW